MDAFAARQNMVESQVRVNDVTDAALQLAMRHVARERLCAPSQSFAAYGEVEPEIAPGRWLMKPREIAKLLHHAHPKAGETALCLAAPYAGAVLSHMGLKVIAQEGDSRAMTVVEPYLKEMGVATIVADMKAPTSANLDIIVCEAAVGEVPATWLKALKVGGRLAVVLKSGTVGRARIYMRLAHGVSEQDVFDASARVLPGFEKAVQFEF